MLLKFQERRGCGGWDSEAGFLEKTGEENKKTFQDEKDVWVKTYRTHPVGAQDL